MKNRSFGWVVPALLAVLLIAAPDAFAGTPGNASVGFYDDILQRFQSAATGWRSIIESAALFLFWTLGTISLVITFGFMAMRKADIGEFFAEFIRFILFFGFFLWLLRNGPNFANSIMQGLSQLGAQAGGLPTTPGQYGVTPSGIVDIGFEIFAKIIDNMSFWPNKFHLSLMGGAMGLGILTMLCLIGINMLLLLVSAWFLAYAGIFFLGFGGSRWTSDMAINYYKTVLGLAAQIMAMVLLIGIGKTFLDQYYAALEADITASNLKSMAALLMACVVLFALTAKIPPLLAGIISGASVGGGGIGNSVGFGTLAAAAGMAAAAAATGGAALAAGGAAAAGGGSAIMAAFSKASENASAGGDGGMPSMGGGGGDSGGGGGGGGGEGGTSTPLGQAAGFTGGGGGGGGGGDSGGGQTKAGKGGAKADAGGQAAGSGDKAVADGGQDGGTDAAPTSQAAEGSHAERPTVDDFGNEVATAAQVADGGADGGTDAAPTPETVADGGADGGTDAAPRGQGAAPQRGAGALAAAAKAGRITADAGVILAKGIGEVAKQKASSIGAAAKDRISQTTGGKIAAAIRAQGSAAQQPQPTFGENSLGGSDAPDPVSEVAAFAQKKPRRDDDELTA
ncbi:P-type conjugative transfer protein TrbL [Xanthomonas euvesicatoria]|uniref:P-type conjugative transfer protein TrbL n=1 Tax=Xanthomonas euvesicatoria TaxID=456327 RepID=UPI001C44A942|nr:P-type conjugative transfer protein TrbL [Xanthomonas euvesicatoria]MBV6831288.1 P-type conjugative transfer protein TrbL [Xanthomonas campestris pv. viegasii]